jgi:alpha/beta superfamily hydrolase
MSKIIFIIVMLLPKQNLLSQNAEGNWLGTLSAKGINLKIGFKIKKVADRYSCTMDSPDQQAFDIPTSSINIEAKTITVKVDAAKVTFTGELKNDTTIEGTFQQGNFSAPLNLIKQKEAIKKANRPQEPNPPFNYYREEVVFKNEKDNIELAGTLTLPDNKETYPIVILVSGSGPQNRNGEILGHKPFLVIADYFAKNGIGVLRYDDRGVAKSNGNFATATTNDFANDAEAAVNYLKTRKETKAIGIAGHSEGGLIAPIVAGRNKLVNFIILLAGPGVRGDKILLAQNYLIAKASGATEAELNNAKKLNQKIYSIVIQSNNKEVLKKNMTELLKKEIKNNSANLPPNTKEEEFVKAQVEEISNPWLINFIKYDPTNNLKKVKCPVLAINGSLDLQVPSQLNLNAIQKNITSNGNKLVTIKEYKNLNHLFQSTITGSPDEYGSNEETFNQQVLGDMVNWIKERK